MEKLVFVYYWGDEAQSGIVIIPFEYSSKDEFNEMLSKKINIAIVKKESYIKIFDTYVYFHREKFEILNLEEWFNNNKEIYAS